MSVRSLLAVLTVASLATSASASTIPQVQQFESELSADSALLARWQVDQMRKVVAFNSTSGAVVPKQLKVFGVEVGVEGVVSGTKMDVSGLRSLQTRYINTNEIDMFDRMPFPAIIAHAKIGLPFGLDGGLRVGGIPKENIDKNDTKASIKNKIFGIDVRKNVITEGLGKPGVTVGLSYTHASGDFDATTPYSAKSATTVSYGGSTYNVDQLDVIGNQHIHWNTNSIGANVVVNKQVAFFNPYAGLSITKNSGSVSSKLTTTGTATVSGFSQDTVESIGESSAKPKQWDTRLLAGFEFSLLPFMRLGINGEYAGKDNLAGAIGLRFQFR